MPPACLKEPYRSLEHEVIDTFLASHHECRPDLPYPESQSDMINAMHQVMRHFEIKRRPIALEWKDIVDIPMDKIGLDK